MTKFQCCRLVSPTLGLIYILYFGNSATFPDGWNWLCGSQIWIASLLQWLRLLVWITCNCILITSFLQIVPKRGHAPQFCDEILNFQCCVTSFLAWSQKIDCMDHRLELRLYSLGSRLYYSWLAILILGAIFVILITWFLQLYLESNVDICPHVAYCYTNFNMDK